VNAIDAMRQEIQYQVDGLSNLALPPPDENCLFVGSGDSYVAALAAQYTSGNRAIAGHPADIIANSSMVDGRHVYFVSISGNTKANALAAQVAAKRGAKTTAITARPDSRLAKACDEMIELRYKSTGVKTAGTISFTASMLTCLAIAAKIRVPASLGSMYKKADAQAEKASKTDKKSFIILGDGILFPAAMYGALKFNEVFGAKAMPYPLEEFCHSPLFSAKKSDQIIILGANGDGKDLDSRLRKERLPSMHVDCTASTEIESLLQAAFFVQLLAVKLARRRKLTDCYFLKNKKLLKTSSDFIYG
jgi:glucosamine--fructose-6-phosphate aminotransferase (isomerizing)